MTADLLRALVAIPSVNPGIAPAEGTGEGAIATFARDWLLGHGVEAWIEDAAPGRPNVVATAGSSDRPVLVLCGHLDTVGTHGMSIPPFEARVDGDRLYARGAYDMKGSVAAIMVTMARLAASPPHGRVIAALVADEEHESLGAFNFVRHHHADACIVTEPCDGSLVLAHKGFVWATITTLGHAAHGSRWDVGVSAITKMGRVIAALDEYDRGPLRERTHPLVGSASLHCALINGGNGLSTYAPECRLQVERRTLPGETVDRVRTELAAVVRGADDSAQMTVTCARDPSVCDTQARVARDVREAIADVTGVRPADSGVGFWMDAAVFASAGIPTVTYGPFGDGAHAATEWVDLPSVDRLVHVLVRAAHRFGCP